MDLWRSRRVFLALASLLLAFDASSAQLQNPRLNTTNAAFFDFQLSCQRREHHLIQWSSDFTTWSTFQHSLSTVTNRLIQVPRNLGPRVFWRTVLTNEPMFPYALVAKRWINFTNVLEVDSFDSTNPVYSTQGLYHPNLRTDRANVAIGDTNPASLANTRVLGRVHVKSNVTVALGPSGCVGTGAYVFNPLNGGTIQSGHLLKDAAEFYWADVMLPPIWTPTSQDTNAAAWLPLPGWREPFVLDDVSYRYVLNTGDYDVVGWIWSANVLITGNVRCWVRSGIDFSTNVIRILTNASLQIFADCPTVALGRTDIDNGLAMRFSYFGTRRNTSLVLDGNPKVTGSFYAPAANVVLRSSGSSSSSSDFIGAMVADTIDFQAPFLIHYDEALATQGPMK